MPQSKQASIIFVDGYDCLVDDERSGRCTWLEHLLSPEEASPHTLWVITSKDRLEWMDDALQTPVSPMSDADGNTVLQTGGIQNSDLRQAIVQTAAGSPLYLDIGFEMWRKIHRKRLPRVEDFAQSMSETLAKADEVWDPDELKLFEILSVPRYWDEVLFRALVSQFANDSDDSDRYQDNLKLLAEHPYIQSSGSQAWQIHPEIRQHFLKRQPQAQQQPVHHWLFDYYQTLSADPSQAITALKEALHHSTTLSKSETAIDWCLTAINQQIRQAPHAEIPIMLQALLESHQATPQQTVLAWIYLGQAQIASYEWEATKDTFKEALSQLELDQADSLLAADAWYALAEVYLALENTFDAKNACLRAVRIRTHHCGAESLAVAEALCRQAEVVASQGRLSEATKLSQQALAIVDNHQPIEPLQLAQFKLSAAVVFCHKHTLDYAEGLCQNVLSMMKTVPEGDRHFLTIHGLGLMGDIYRLMGPHKGQQSFDYYQQAVHLAEKVLGPDTPWTQCLLEAQMRLCRKLGWHDQADELANRQELNAQIGSCEVDLEMAGRLNRVGLALFKKGQYGEAEPLLKRALVLSKELLGESHPDVAMSLNNLAGLYESQGRYSEAEPLYKEALELRKQLLGEEHLDIATSLNDLALLYTFQRRYSEAEPLYREALRQWKRLLGEKHHYTATTLNNLAMLYASQKRYDEAEPLYQKALELRKQLLGEKHPDVSQSLNNLADLYCRQGRYDKAESISQKVIGLRKQLLGEDHPDVGQGLNNLAFLYTSMKRYDTAEPLYLEAISILLKQLGEDHPTTQIANSNFVSCLRAALDAGQGELLSEHPVTQALLAQLRNEPA
ncbi:tetratricopeptide repeat protein [Oscillatoria sp. CS-180]|uniref:tetratricopeptide repeat protein n=1 Tax=Oscillatoria sp. CS-180 TaxID=3021720 RepID=UPI002330611F|nr:tetratricopeptide repeat protein [Oscillatoria sp. CS-180]MDB9529788.1 tetratricopeptide repeat protein [Oscillatoria sp. CS-180]